VGSAVERELVAIESAIIAIRRRAMNKTVAVTTRNEDQRVRNSVQPVLDALEEADDLGVAPTVGAIARLLGLDQSRASKVAATAIELGLVRREADQSDGRRSLLRLTRSGERQLSQVHKVRQGVFDTAMSDWSQRQRADFARLLTKFVADLDASRQGS
jgi:DNA-binding MarR family transcriptional regulator